jgi:hypothetical protein
MDVASVFLIFKVIKEAVTVTSEIRELIKRVEAGEVITVEECNIARKASQDVTDDWNEGGE